MLLNRPIVALALALACAVAQAATSLDVPVRNARAAVDNANAQLRALQNDQTTLRNNIAAAKRAQTDNTRWLAAQPALVKTATDDVAAQKTDRPPLQEKLETLVAADPDRAKAIAMAQTTLGTAKINQAKLHTDAFARFISKDPGMSAYAPVKEAKSALDTALVLCQQKLDRSADYKDALDAMKSAETRLAALRADVTTNPRTLAQASQLDMDTSNRLERMRSSAADADDGVKQASVQLEAATVAFRPTLDKFEDDLAKQPDYAAALKDTTDDQNAVTTAQAALTQAGNDERALRKQLADADAKGSKAAAFLKSNTAEETARKNQNAAIEKQLPASEQTLSQMEQRINNQRNNVNQLNAQLRNLENAQRNAGG